MSPSEDDNEEEEDEWRPEKPEKGRRVSKKPKATGVSPLAVTVDDVLLSRSTAACSETSWH